MTKSDEQAERPRRPAARRAAIASPSDASLETSAGDAAQSPRRIHARRVENNDDDSVPPPKPRPIAVRAGRISSNPPPPPPSQTTSSPPPSAARSNPPPSAARSSPPPSAARSNPPPSAARRNPPPSAAGSARAVSALRDLEPITTLHSDAAAPESAALLAATATLKRSTALRVRTDLGDEFGLDAHYEAKMRPFFEAMCRNYLHLQVMGAQHIPERGRALLVSNHSRSLAWDGILLRTMLRLNHASQREARWLVEDDQFHAPFLGTFISRLGAVRACQENAERLLARDELLAVFPEGAKGADKRYQDRHKLHRFGRGGYVKLALRTGAPVIPVAIVGRDDPSPMLSRVRAFSKWIGTPLFALSSGLPRLGPLGVPPVPGRWRIAIGEPIGEIARQDAGAIRDEGLVHELNECVRSAIRQLVDQAMPGIA